MDSDAIPPSSPPHASTANLPSSPFFEPNDNVFSPKSSSPPPLFSSDDSRESVDVTNYESPRIYKNKRKGAWWDTAESAQNTPEPRRRRIARNNDSGVYMMSDASVSAESLPSLPRPEHKSPFSFSVDGSSESPNESPSRRAIIKKPRKRMAEHVFNNNIRAGLERNAEAYELRNLELQDGDIQRISDLASVIKNGPDPGRYLPAEGQYRSMVPELYINLGSNKLCRLTPSLFHVRHLTTLILRDNQIEELPQQIGQLQNLRVLDLSLNKLHFLPYEVLRLLEPHGVLYRLNTFGNPILEPISPERFDLIGPEGQPALADVASMGQEMYDEMCNSTIPEQLCLLYKSIGTTAARDPAIIWMIRLLESWEESLANERESQLIPGEWTDESYLKFYEHHPGRTAMEFNLQMPQYIARTPVAYFTQSGDLLRNSPAPLRSNSQDYIAVVETDGGTFIGSTRADSSITSSSTNWFSPPPTSRVSSLLTTSLHSVFRKRHQDDLTIKDIQNMISEPVPHDVHRILSAALENDVGGYGEFRKCHICKKDYVVARAEWIEFWSIGLGCFFPFQIKVCSWGCVPNRISRKPEKGVLW